MIQSDGTFDVSNYYTSREGSTSHVDHANVLYQIPEDATGLPMVFLHGYGQSRMGWMTTPDGREGWSDMFLRMGHSVWLIDQPRRGEAGQTSVAGTMTTTPSDQTWYTQFRIGTYLNDEFTYNEGSQFPQGEDVLDQFFRQMTPDTGMDNANNDQNIDNTVVAQAVAAAIDEIYDRTGQDSILVTHSQGGLPGWEVPLYTDHVAAIVAIEPGGAPQVDSDAYNAMVEQNIPVTFYYGDYIGEEFTDVPAAAMWSMMAASADTFTEAYNAAGGSSTVVHLPDEASPETTTLCSRTEQRRDRRSHRGLDSGECDRVNRFSDNTRSSGISHETLEATFELCAGGQCGPCPGRLRPAERRRLIRRKSEYKPKYGPEPGGGLLSRPECRRFRSGYVRHGARQCAGGVLLRHRQYGGRSQLHRRGYRWRPL